MKPNIFVQFASVLLLAFTASVVAEENTDTPCVNNQPIAINGSSYLKLSDMNTDIDKLNRLLLKHANRRDKFVSHHYDLKQRLDSLQAARQELVDSMYVAGCKKLENDASTEARIERLEKLLAASH